MNSLLSKPLGRFTCKNYELISVVLGVSAKIDVGFNDCSNNLSFVFFDVKIYGIDLTFDKKSSMPSKPKLKVHHTVY